MPQPLHDPLHDRAEKPKLRALDLFCGAGGVSMGLHRAGFDVVGVDIRPQPRYPFTFIQADVMSIGFAGFDFIWASPPCQAYSVAAHGERSRGKVYPDLIEPVRQKLKASGTPYAIENVPRSPLLNPIRLRGTMFPELRVIRERWFELSWFMMQPPLPVEPRGLLVNHGYVSVAGNGTQGWAYKKGLRWLTADVRRAMGIDWMARNELSQAIPPAYAEFIGRAALSYLSNRDRAASAGVGAPVDACDARVCGHVEVPSVLSHGAKNEGATHQCQGPRSTQP